MWSHMKLTNEWAHIHPIFHVFILKKCIGDPVSIIYLECLGVNENLSREQVPV